MSDKPTWNDEMRQYVRNYIRTKVRGEVRLAKSDHDDILQACQDACEGEECPEAEQPELMKFAKEELAQARSMLSAEQASWPAETDCDRMDRVEAALRDKGIVFWQASPCCDTCTTSELADRVVEVDERHPGFRDRLRGYAFFIDQTLPESLAESSKVSVYLAYGWVQPDADEVESDIDRRNALGIADEICGCLRHEGFEPEWEGDFSKEIGVTLNWQRRTMLR